MFESGTEWQSFETFNRILEPKMGKKERQQKQHFYGWEREKGKKEKQKKSSNFGRKRR